MVLPALAEPLLRAFRFSLTALALLAGCGMEDADEEHEGPPSSSKPSPRDCRTFTPCGGDLLGRWVMRSSCVGSAVNDPACAGYATNQSVSGTAIYDFGSDATLRYEGEVHVRYDVSATEACAQAVAHKDAAGYCKLIQDSSDDNPRVPATIDCTASDGLCTCHGDQGPISGGADSRYSVSGNSVTIDSDTLGYCVAGDTLTLGSLAGEPATVLYRP